MSLWTERVPLEEPPGSKLDRIIIRAHERTHGSRCGHSVWIGILMFLISNKLSDIFDA
jgi:hypothetical protein